MTFQKQKREWNNIPTVAHSFIFQRGRYTTNHCFPYKNSIRKLIWLPVWHYILSDFKPTRKSSWEVFPYVPMNWWTVQMILCVLSWAWETHEMLTWKATWKIDKIENWFNADYGEMLLWQTKMPPLCLHFGRFFVRGLSDGLMACLPVASPPGDVCRLHISARCHLHLGITRLDRLKYIWLIMVNIWIYIYICKNSS